MSHALRPLRWFLAAASLIAVGTGVGVLLWSHAAKLGHVNASLQILAPWLFAWRIALIAAVVLGWKSLVRGCARLGNWSDAVTRRALALRWRSALWLLCLELVVVDNVVGRCAGLLQTWAR